MYRFGRTSEKRLETCHPDLQMIMHTAIRRSSIDFGIAEGHRSIERQKQLYDEGKSRIDGITKKGKHNYNPSLAADVYAWYDGKANWDTESLCYIAGVVQATAVELFDAGKISHKIRWGGNWDMDGVILLDQNFDDAPHFELIAA